MPPTRKRRAAHDAEQEQADVETQAPVQRRRVSAAEDDDVDEAAEGDDNQDQMVKNMVRLALASEYSRAPIRRSDISARVLGSQSRSFKLVFQLAQQQLRAVFGMEMTELPARDKVTLQQRRAAAKSQSQGQKTTNAWILTSVLPDKFRTPDILPPARVPTAESEAQYTALYTFIVSCIMLNGGSLADGKLERYLSRASVDDNTPFTQPATLSTLDKTEKLLKKMERDGYVVKVKETNGGDETVEWTVGPRGKVEIGDVGVRRMVRDVYGETNDPEDLERRLNRSLGVSEATQTGGAQNTTRRRPIRRAEAQENNDDEAEQEQSEEEE